MDKGAQPRNSRSSSNASPSSDSNLLDEILDQAISDSLKEWTPKSLPYNITPSSKFNSLLNTEVNLGPFGSRIGDIIPIINEVPPDQNRIETLTRPRESFADWATLPAEIISTLSPFKPKSATSGAGLGIIRGASTFKATSPERAALREAKALSQSSQYHSPEEIYQKTGWYQDPTDKKWRTELPDPGTFQETITPESFEAWQKLEKPHQDASPAQRSIPLKLTHPNLPLESSSPNAALFPPTVYAEKYPQNQTGPASGYYNPKANTIRIIADNPSDAHNALIHEFQHYSQRQSDLAFGTNVSKIPDSVISSVKKQAESKLNANLDLDSKLGKEIAYLQNLYDSTSKTSQDGINLRKQILSKINEKNALVEQAEQLRSVAFSPNPSDRRYAAYLWSLGETEARNVAKRSGMSLEELRNSLPLHTVTGEPLIEGYTPLPADTFEYWVDTGLSQ